MVIFDMLVIVKTITSVLKLFYICYFIYFVREKISNVGNVACYIEKY